MSKPDRLLKFILIWAAIPMITIWLPLIRGLMDGPTYSWGNRYWGFLFSGQGTGGDYWILPFLAVFAVLLLYLGWRGSRRPFHVLLLLWTVPFAFESVYYGLRYPERYRFRGDTLGVDVSLAWVGPLFWGGLALLSLLWVIRDLKNKDAGIERSRWTKVNKTLLYLVILLIPVQFVLLRFGVPHGTTDQIGVLLTLAQWVLLNLSLVPWRSRQAKQVEAGKQKLSTHLTV